MRKSLHKIGLMIAVMSVLLAGVAQAATQNYSLGVHVTPIAVLISGQRTASVTNVAKFTIPAKMKLIGVTATARASGGSTPTLTVDVLAATTSLLSAPVAVTAGAVAEATIATSAIPDETVLNISLAITGSSPTWDDISILLTFVPL